MGRRRHLALLLVSACFIVACTQPGPSVEGSPTESPMLLAGQPMVDCTISGERPVKAQAPALCGSLTVPEDRSKPHGRQVRLRVAVVPAVSAAPEPDPLFVLAGGPGDAATRFFSWLPAVFRDVHATRDIVMVDQRGTGGSNPLELPEMPDTAGLSGAQAEALRSAWAKGALASIDADPRFYTSTVAAEDLDAVRAALGYETINVYGTSYGGTLAQYYLRQHSQRVRVAVLDGSTPVDVPVLERLAASSQAALDLLIDRCAQNAACHAAFPRLAAEWAALMDRLATPVTIVDPASGAEAVIDQRLLADAIHPALLTESTAAQVPLVVHLAYEGRWIEAAKIISAPTSSGPTQLMADEIFCSETWARYDPAEVARHGAGSYALARELGRAEERAARCRHLPQGVVPANDATPVATDTPVLWLVADGDPQDPPANLAAVPSQQPNSRIVVMPAQQHVVGHLGCTPSLVATFLKARRADGLDVTCVTSRPSQLQFRLN